MSIFQSKFAKSIIFFSICFTGFYSNGQNIVESNNKFALNLLQKIANSSENLFFSPISISTALYMVAGGAKRINRKTDD